MGWVNRRILIVDDNADIHKDFRKILGSSQKKTRRSHLDAIEQQLFADEHDDSDDAGKDDFNHPDIYDVEYEIDSAYQGEEAVALVEQACAQNRPYALIFMDVRMPPGIDGIESIYRIWSKSPNIEVVICTAYSDYSFEEILQKLGTTDRLLFLNKPFDSIVVKQMALSLTRKWTLHEEARQHVRRLKSEIDQRRESETRLNHMINHDDLTGLANRNQLQIELAKAIQEARRQNTRFALFFVDLDRFKEVNDTLGYQNGDKLLAKVASRLQSTFGEIGTVFRQGGDEFAILLPRITSMAQTSKIAHHLQRVFEPHFDLGELSIEIHPSIGIVIYPDHGCNMDMLMRHADMTLISAKSTEQGFRFYRDNMNLFTPQRLLLLSELRRAISSDELMLYFQPKVNLVDGCVEGVEALTRWPHPSHGFIPPSEFIPLAERCGIIRHLTHWVLKEVPRQWRMWSDQGIDLAVSINLTAQDVLDPQLPAKVRDILAEFNMPPSRLGFEVSERGVMEDPAQAIQSLLAISQMGISISIDNFGTGYSSLAYLKTMPVTQIKIDQSFVEEMGHNLNDIAIVRSMIDLGHNLGLKVMAEGVSTRESYNMLKEFGCDAMQGSYVNHPVPAGELLLWLESSEWMVATTTAE